jgi:hypothetical protein
MSVGTAGPLSLKVGVCAIPTSKAVRRERAGDEGDQGAASSVDIGVKATWVTHRGAKATTTWAGAVTCLARATSTATGAGLVRTHEQLRAAGTRPGSTHERFKRRRRRDLLVGGGGRRRHPLRGATRRPEPMATLPSRGHASTRTGGDTPFEGPRADRNQRLEGDLSTPGARADGSGGWRPPSDLGVSSFERHRRAQGDAVDPVKGKSDPTTEATRDGASNGGGEVGATRRPASTRGL